MVEQCGCHWTGYADLIKAPETQYCFEKLCEFKTAEIMQCLIKLFLGMDQGICSNCRSVSWFFVHTRPVGLAGPRQMDDLLLAPRRRQFRATKRYGVPIAVL